MNLVDSLVNGKNKIIPAFESKENSSDYLIFVSKDSKGNYILPKGYNSIQKVGGLKEVIYLTLYDDLFKEVSC
ncbi:hypothetical protein KAJ87_00480 [Candidatus Pacearchaeota archaeon]|nr:hypothetical protein [Candidatus Pacearchaeota archaeon]